MTLTMVEGGENVGFKIHDPDFYQADDVLRHSVIKFRHPTYRIIMFEETSLQIAEPFTLSISVE